jgi:catechol 2,3-dioxygenase-like lactoylglutathione lyase family enzyme
MIAHLVLNISDYKQSRNFYAHFLIPLGYHLQTELEGDWGASVLFRNGEHSLWLKWEKENKHESFVRDVGLDHLAFKATGKEQVKELFQSLRSQNVVITRAPRDYPEYNTPYYAFYFRDPDGIPLEVVWKE